VRFQVTRVMDAIEQRLTTDVTLAQAVVDLGQVVRDIDLDGSRPVNLVRIGMVIDALSRHLLDGGAMLYGVVDRPLLSDPALTSKERMVLGRWADDGLIEVVPVIEDRVAEIADMTGLPVIAVTPPEDFAEREGWLANGSGRVLSLAHCSGTATLAPLPLPTEDDAPASAAPAVGRAKVPTQKDAQPPPDAPAAEPAAPAAEPATESDAESDAEPAAESDAAEPAVSEADIEEQADTSTDTDAAEQTAAEADPGTAETVNTAGNGRSPLPIAVFANRGVLSVVRTRISWRRFRRAEPNRAHAKLLGRQWRCDEFECPVFGERRRIGQPVPRLRDGVPVCPRHDVPVVDIGPRGPSYPVSIVVDDLPRRRVVVRCGAPVSVGSAAADPDDPELLSVVPWLHQAAAAWISERHLRLEADDDGLLVTDLSQNGTVVWLRTGPDGRPTAKPLRRESHRLGEWDSVELYTGIELMRGDRRLAAVLGRDELASVLLDAPTAAHHKVSEVSA
jgi:hypothetical protein